MEVYNHNPKIYLISGKARNGKTTTANMMKTIYEAEGKKVIITRYGKYIKNYVKEFFGWDGNEDTKPRELMQQLGTNVIREKLNKDDFFVKRMIEDIEIMSYFFDIIILDDARFPIEIDDIKKIYANTTTIRINRLNFVSDLTEKQLQHPTETSLDKYDGFDYVITNSGTLVDLEKKVQELIKGGKNT